MGTTRPDDVRKPSKRRVLFIGRQQGASEATDRYLEYCGNEVARAEDSITAITKADELRPQVLICDLDLKSGEDRALAAQRIQQLHHSALVIITNYHCVEVFRQFPKLAVAGCLRKPVSLRQLARTVSSVAAD